MEDSVQHEDGKRFYISTGHGNAVLNYRLVHNGVMIAYHTFVPEQERGKGLAERLAVAAFDLAKERGLKVRPDCSYIIHFLDKHPEYRFLTEERQEEQV